MCHGEMQVYTASNETVACWPTLCSRPDNNDSMRFLASVECYVCSWQMSKNWVLMLTRTSGSLCLYAPQENCLWNFKRYMTLTYSGLTPRCSLIKSCQFHMEPCCSARCRQSGRLSRCRQVHFNNCWQDWLLHNFQVPNELLHQSDKCFCSLMTFLLAADAFSLSF